MTLNEEQPPTTGPGKVSRRALAVGVAWSVPVIAVASAAPAMAASGPSPTLTFLGACKWPGNSCPEHKKSYSFVFSVKNESSLPIYLCSPQMVVVSGDGATADWTPAPIPGGCYGPIAPNGTQTIAFYFENSDDSSNLVFVADLSVAWGHECPCGSDLTNHPRVIKRISVDGTKPNGVFCTCTA